VSYGYVPEELRLTDLDLMLAPGEFLVLTGPSGSGKTTITRLINGLIPHYYEGVLIGQVQVGGLTPGQNTLWELPVGSVFQNPRTQFFTTDVVSEIAFGAENLGLPTSEIWERVNHATEQFALEKLRGRSVFALSGGEKQRLACASVAAVKPSIYVLDEPSANLDQASTEQLRAIMAQWKASGASVVVAEHRLGYLRELADRVMVLEGGRVHAMWSGAEFRGFSSDYLHSLGLRTAGGKPPALPSGNLPDAVIEISRLVCRHRSQRIPGISVTQDNPPAVQMAQLQVAQGQVTALLGANGAGKTTFAHWLAGLRRDPGQLLVAGRVWSQAERRRRVFLVLQDVNLQLFTESVREEVALALDLGRGKRGRQRSVGRRHGRGVAVIDTPPEDAVAEILADLDLMAVADRHPLALSSGQKQRVAVAAALASGREMIVLDEPTSGLDWMQMQNVAQALRKLASVGRTVIVATHDLDLVEAAADQVVHLEQGQVVG
jgi:energy-coupling factor transport system ATP-binding protein